jgi:hypothetical protein
VNWGAVEENRLHAFAVVEPIARHFDLAHDRLWARVLRRGNGSRLVGEKARSVLQLCAARPQRTLRDSNRRVSERAIEIGIANGVIPVAEPTAYPALRDA